MRGHGSSNEHTKSEESRDGQNVSHQSLECGGKLCDRMMDSSTLGSYLSRIHNLRK